MKKKIFALLLVMVMIVSATACGSSGSSGSDSKEGDKVYKLRFTTQYQPAHPAYAAMERIKEKVEKESEGRIEITLFPSSQLGDWELVFETMMKGAVDMALIPVPSSFDKRLSIAATPYLVTEYSQLEKGYGKDSHYYEFVSGVCDELNIKFLGAYAEGFIDYGGVKEPPASYTTVGAKKGLYRTYNDEIFKSVVETMGYPTMTIPYADLYTAMQTGVVDGWFGGTPMANWNDQRDVIKYFVPYNIAPESASFFMSKEIYEGLPEDLRAIVENACLEESSHSFETCEQFDNEAMQKMKDYGITVMPITSEERAAIADQVRAQVWPKMEEIVGKEVLDNMKADVQK